MYDFLMGLAQWLVNVFPILLGLALVVSMARLRSHLLDWLFPPSPSAAPSAIAEDGEVVELFRPGGPSGDEGRS
jgi:hypothetical protein